jgi:hypothetical protein
LMLILKLRTLLLKLRTKIFILESKAARLLFPHLSAPTVLCQRSLKTGL